MMIVVPTRYVNNASRFLHHYHQPSISKMATQLPNPQILSHALNTISTECVKLANLPALDQGAAILQQLTQMNQQMGQMNQRMDQMNQRMDQMNQRMDQRFNSLEIAIRAMYVPFQG